MEVNRHLSVLTDSWERGGLPLHMNLAVNHHHYPQDMTTRLKQQNHLLTEVNKLQKKNFLPLKISIEKYKNFNPPIKLRKLAFRNLCIYY